MKIKPARFIVVFVVSYTQKRGRVGNKFVCVGSAPLLEKGAVGAKNFQMERRL